MKEFLRQIKGAITSMRVYHHRVIQRTCLPVACNSHLTVANKRKSINVAENPSYSVCADIYSSGMAQYIDRKLYDGKLPH